MCSCRLWLLAGLFGWLSVAGTSWAQSKVSPDEGTCLSWTGTTCAQAEACPGEQTRIYGGGEYLLWWLRPAHVPVLATSDNSLAGLPPGALGQPGTTVLLAGDLGTGPSSGARFTAGLWLDGDQTFGIEGNYFFLGQGRSSRVFVSDGGVLGTATVFRPFYDALLDVENALFVAGPGVAGGLNINLLQRLQGSEVNLRSRPWSNGNLHCDVLGGFRFLALDENLDLLSLSVDTASFFPTSSSFESFAARNRFYGGQLGLETEWQRGRLSLKVLTRLALGNMNQVVHINGNTVVVDPTTETTLFSGPATLFAQATNIGRHERNQFAFIPEIGLSAGWSLTDSLKVSTGYTLLWLSNVARPGDAIDFISTVPTFPPPAGATHPSFAFQNASFWAQGITVSLELRY